MINGQPQGYFQEKKGLRQRDPLSPYLFIICMEVLSRLLDQAAKVNKFDYHPRCKAMNLTHLIFTDDLIIFAGANLHSLNRIKKVLDKFNLWSGLKVSSEKS